MKLFTRIVSATALVFSMQASADLVDFNPNPSNKKGKQVVYEMDGSYWGLLGLSGGALDYTSPNSGLLTDLNASVQSGNVLGFYYADNMPDGDWAGDYFEGQMLDDSAYIAETYNESDRFFDAIWVNFDSNNVVFSNGNGRNTMGSTVTQSGVPFELTATVPAPATALLAGLALMLTAGFRRKA